MVYSPCLDVAVRQDGKTGPVSRNSKDHFQVQFNLIAIDVDIIAELYSHISFLQLFALLESPVSSSHNRAIKWRLHQHSCKLATGKKQKHT
jgi:hypothetical protein